LENVQAMVAHESPRTTYDRTNDWITFDEVKRDPI